MENRNEKKRNRQDLNTRYFANYSNAGEVHVFGAMLGIRKYFKKKSKGSRYRTAYEFGAYFRYNLNTLGRVKIEEVDFTVTMEPRGSILGAYFKVLFPAGRKSVRLKPEREWVLPPIIYHPRSKH